jgi:hypothetical protein
VAALLIALAVACAAPAAARALGVPERAERDGRLAFAQGRYGDAAAAFGAAAEARPGVAELLYDSGISAYRGGDLEGAVGMLRQAVEQTGRQELAAAGHFALGNAGVRAVEQAMAAEGAAPADPQAAIDGLAAAAQSYRRALDLRPDWEDAGHNLEATRLLLQQLQQQLPPPQSGESQQQQGQQGSGQEQQGVGQDEQQQQEQGTQDGASPQQAPQSAGREDEKLEPDQLARAIIAAEEEREERRRQEQLRTEPVERDW